MEELRFSIKMYKTMEISGSPPEEKIDFHEWYMRQMRKLTDAEQDIRVSIDKERERLKKELLKLNAMEHDLLTTAAEHPMYLQINSIKKERFHEN